MEKQTQPDLSANERFNTERDLIGALLSAGDRVTYDMASSIVTPRHFSDNFNARIFDMIGKLLADGLWGFPMVARLIFSLRDDPTVTGAGTVPSKLIASYISSAAPAIAIEGHARQIRKDKLTEEMRDAMKTGDSNSAAELASEINDLNNAHRRTGGAYVTLGVAAESRIDELNEIVRDGVIPDVPFAGTNDINNLLGGWRPGRFYVVAGRPGMGKSSFALSVLRQTAAKGHGVAFFSLEMTAAELAEMALCDAAWTSYHRIEYRNIQPTKILQDRNSEHFQTLVEARHKIQKIPLLISDKSGQTISDIRTAAKQYAQRLHAEGKRLDVVCIDHLNLIKPTGAYAGNKVAETEEISGALKVMAKELGVAVVCLVQLSRGVEGRESKIPTLSDLRWSGAIEQDADVVMFVYREAYYAARIEDIDERMLKLRDVGNKLELIVAKHRGGPTDNLQMFCDIGCGVIRDSAR